MGVVKFINSSLGCGCCCCNKLPADYLKPSETIDSHYTWLVNLALRKQISEVIVSKSSPVKKRKLMYFKAEKITVWPKICDSLSKDWERQAPVWLCCPWSKNSVFLILAKNYRGANWVELNGPQRPSSVKEGLASCSRQIAGAHKIYHYENVSLFIGKPDFTCI